MQTSMGSATLRYFFFLSLKWAGDYMGAAINKEVQQIHSNLAHLVPSSCSLLLRSSLFLKDYAGMMKKVGALTKLRLLNRTLTYKEILIDSTLSHLYLPKITSN